MFLPVLGFSSVPTPTASPHFRPRLAPLRALYLPSVVTASVVSDSLKLLEWDKVCDAVSSFAGTALGREATKEMLWDVEGLSYEGSKKLLGETAAAVELINYGAGGVDFAGVDTVLVKSAIDRACRGFSLNGSEAIAVVCLVLFAESLQITLKTALKEGAEWYNRFMPLSQLILNIVINRSFVKLVQQVIDEDGSVKDSASSDLKRSREQVRVLERKLYQLMDKLVRSDNNGASSSEVCLVNGRCCIKAVADYSASFDGLLLSSGSGVGSMIEPIAAIPLNDELQQARILVAKAEENVLSGLTDKMLEEIDEIQNLLDTIIQLDAVAARAKFSIAYNGTFPNLYLPSDDDGIAKGGDYAGENFNIASLSHLPRRQWKLYMPKAHHPLLLLRHRENLINARKDLVNATSISQLEKDHPVPVNFMVSGKINVLVITGPNTGGKTISLKTIGLASLMAKTGIYVLASEPVKIPWFDAIYADIGDEQSLTQSLSTFSGHLKQIGAIRTRSTSKSLVLLDEVGAGTNPLEGAALGMSLLESFAETRSFLTIVTTHHGELKTLKYSNSEFENACVEFDEESLKPTFKILWGVPGRSNAINVAERLGLPHMILESARKLHGTASAEINEVIIDMERYKQYFQQNLQEAQQHLTLSKKLRESLSMAKLKISDHVVLQKKRKVKAVSDSAAIARSILRSKMQQYRESTITEKASERGNMESNRKNSTENIKQQRPNSVPTDRTRQKDITKAVVEEQTRIPEVGDIVYVASLNKQATVLKVETSKGVILVQAGNIKLRMKLTDTTSQQVRR